MEILVEITLGGYGFEDCKRVVKSWIFAFRFQVELTGCNLKIRVIVPETKHGGLRGIAVTS